jgi:hypothetical protein
MDLFCNERSSARVARRGAVFALGATLLIAAGASRAEDDPVFRIEFNDGKVTPQRLEVPAKRRFKLELHNVGKEPAEFESKELRKEKGPRAGRKFQLGHPHPRSGRIRVL